MKNKDEKPDKPDRPERGERRRRDEDGDAAPNSDSPAGDTGTATADAA
jgi:small subunit ribosomal protein S6